MKSQEFFQQLDSRIAQHDLLRHPFYKAWAAGELTRDDLRKYACDYYHHVNAFPTYLAELAIRLDDSELRRAILSNMADEKGITDASAGDRPHSELWLDFAEAMGAPRELRHHRPVAEVAELMAWFHGVASEGSAEEALAAFYAYESQVPRVAQEKARGLRETYGADATTCAYFTLHATADVHHADIWRQQLGRLLQVTPAAAKNALEAAEAACKALWHALDGIESRRMACAA